MVNYCDNCGGELVYPMDDLESHPSSYQCISHLRERIEKLESSMTMFEDLEGVLRKIPEAADKDGMLKRLKIRPPK